MSNSEVGMDVMLETRDLAKTFGTAQKGEVQAVKGIDLQIQKGEILSLLGPNGAGKTTTISMISGLIEPTRGDAFIGGCSITRQPVQAKSLLGVVPQEIALYPTMSARRNLEFFGRTYGLSGKDLARRVDAMLDFVELTDRQSDRIETYSGGMSAGSTSLLVCPETGEGPAMGETVSSLRLLVATGSGTRTDRAPCDPTSI
jgi:ABC-2 type transport system ATP-binding protein